MSTTKYVCSKCGRTLESQALGSEGQTWLIARRRNTWQGEMIIRCPHHITRYAYQLADKRDVTDANRRLMLKR
jgi:DNA-directed RNA polymerase subunit RPC12/RpoP